MGRAASSRMRKRDGHGWIAKEIPRAAHVGIQNARLGRDDCSANRLRWIRGQRAEQSLIHRRLRRRGGETGGSPNADRPSVRREQQRRRQALFVYILEESVQAVHDQEHRQAIAVGQRGGRRIVQQIRKGPLLFRAVTRVIHQQRAGVNPRNNFLRSRGRIQAVGENFRSGQRGRQSERGGIGLGGEIDAGILIRNHQHLLHPGSGAASVFVVHDLGNNQAGVGYGARRNSARGYGGESGVL